MEDHNCVATLQSYSLKASTTMTTAITTTKTADGDDDVEDAIAVRSGFDSAYNF